MFIEKIQPNYKCNKCYRTYHRDSTKAWMNSYCGKTDKPARLYRFSTMTNDKNNGLITRHKQLGYQI